MIVLVLNSGSSSLKFNIFEMMKESSLSCGVIEKIGQKNSLFTYNHHSKKIKVKNHDEAMKIVLDMILDKKNGVVKSKEEVKAVGHRVVHGGNKYTKSVIINNQVIHDIKRFSQYAPLHNPSNLLGIKAAMKFFPNIPHVAVFDTAFHQTMPEYAYVYGLPYEYLQKYGIRKYGFHGLSHQYVAERAAIILEKPLRTLKLITSHIGNGSSITAILNGKSIDTTMGMTPLQGVIMGTRCGSIDPSIVEFLMEKEKLNFKKVIELLNKKSGLLGLSGVSSDLRDLEKVAIKNKRAKLALDVHIYQIQKFIGSYIYILGGVDAIVFTGGIGQNSARVRFEVCKPLVFLDTYIDPKLNKNPKGEAIISTGDSKIKILVIPTNEELLIARETVK